ncbi:GNAT family N-acetyltransferase [Acanthopleuribacter pedis]|uniref:GNAT family N-acetyltransferase n=1 Tax=Acanthopleuribacter pedis TaxID=442870 RepID=A0A8J7Q135_9BACT|nr:GNAT family protein [Acanthopleuribacter pedis]MBO1318472.1 GNAT family N-acetyltransferase [Acanthopleuribacter pedis]
MKVAIDVDAFNQLEVRTPRLLIRRMQDADFEAQLAQEIDPRVMRFIRAVPPREQAEERVRSFIKPWSGEDMVWLSFTVEALDVADIPAGTVLGAVVFRISERQVGCGEIGYRVGPDFKGKGIAYEASQAVLDAVFGQSNLHKMSARCVDANKASSRILEKMGMQREGVLRQEALADGERRDLLVYGLLRPEWEAGRNS